MILVPEEELEYRTYMIYHNSERFNIMSHPLLHAIIKMHEEEGK